MCRVHTRRPHCAVSPDKWRTCWRPPFLWHAPVRTVANEEFPGIFRPFRWILEVAQLVLLQKKKNNKRPEVFRTRSSPRDLLFVYRFYVLRNRTGGPELKDYWINCGRQRRKSTHHSIFSLWWLSYTLSIFSSAPHNLKEKKIRRKLNNLQLKNIHVFGKCSIIAINLLCQWLVCAS